MSFDRYAGMASAIGILLIWAIIAWLGVAGPIWRAYWTASPEQWLGFAGNVVGALVALGTAFILVRPAQKQLTEIIGQNNQVKYDRLRTRLRELNDERLRIYRITVALEIVENITDTFVNSIGSYSAQLDINAGRLAKDVEEFHKSAGLAWGGTDVQALRIDFLEQSLIASETITRITLGYANEPPNRKVFRMADRERWKRLKERAFLQGACLDDLVVKEIKKAAVLLARMEPIIFPDIE